MAELFQQVLGNFSTGGFDSFYHKLALALFISSVHAAEPDMRKVFDPFKVRNRHPPGIEIDIGNDDNPFFL